MCEQCGAESPQWHGKCSACSEWGTLVEYRVPESASLGARRAPSAQKPVPAFEVEESSGARLTTGVQELDRVLGGGLVPGALILLSGDPGIGKSTLLLQAANSVAASQGRCLYVSGEESIGQVGLRSRRLGAASQDLLLLAETDVDAVSEEVRREPPALLLVDSIQAMCSPEISAPPGSVSQVRDCAARLLRLAKDLGVPTILVGHVTKEGVLAGPRLLEHMVDTVLSLEGDRHSGYRILRSTKNRFGSTDELGLFAMSETGLEGIPDASAALLAERRSGSAGSSVVAALEGSRPLLLEVQALVTQASPGGNPRRSVTGLDYGRACLVLAVLEKRAGLPVGSADVFVNVPGGIRVTEPAADLGLALAVASSFQDQPLAPDMACLGEVGLTGEIRSVPQLGRRLGELARQGFQRCLAPRQAEARGAEKIEVVTVTDLAEAFRAAFAR
jgi:DNA repair protein RadA/Sms